MDRGRRTTQKYHHTQHTTPRQTKAGWPASRGPSQPLYQHHHRRCCPLRSLGGGGVFPLSRRKSPGWLAFLFFFSSARSHWLLGYVVFDTKPYQTCCC